MHIAALLAALLVVLFIYGTLPGMVPNLHNAIDTPSIAKCLSNSFGEGRLQCTNIGYPTRIPIVFGLPVATLVAVLGHATGQDYFALATFVYGAFFAVALLGAFGFFRLFTASWSVALLGAMVFLISPIVSGQEGFGPLRVGFALLPTYLLLTIRCFDALRQPGLLRQAAWTLVLCCVQLFALFCDGYSFVMTCVAGLACCLFHRGIGLSMAHASALGKRLLVYLFATTVAYMAYRSYVPAGALQSMPLDFFRGQGTDVVTMLLPSSYLWFFDASGWHPGIGGGASYSFGADIKYAYLGYSFLAAALGAAVLLWRKQVPVRGLTVAVLLAGLMAAGLSLGPSLKVGDFRAEASQPAGKSFGGYLMPAEAATADLHTGWIYEHVPGVNVMRAVYRWGLLLRLALVLALVTMLSWLVAGKRFVLASLLSLLAIIESMPDVSDHLKVSDRLAASVRTVHDEAIPDFRRHVRKGEKVVLVQLHERPAGNQYAASFFCTWAQALCYNVGGDKAAGIARNGWPAEVEELVYSQYVEDNIREVFLNGKVDVVVTPFFDLRKVAYDFPKGMVSRDQVSKQLVDIADHLGLDLVQTRYFASLRPGPRFNPAACGLACWQDWKEETIATTIAWGPKATFLGSRFNEQMDGRSTFWVKSAELMPGTDLALGPRALASFLNGHGLTAQVPGNYEDSLAVGEHAVYLLDRAHRRKQLLGNLTIHPPQRQ